MHSPSTGNRDAQRTPPRLPDPRVLVLSYLSWYSVVWISSVEILAVMFCLQLTLFALLRGFTPAHRRILFACALVGIVLSCIGIAVAKESAHDILLIWAKWGILILATLSVSLVLPAREMFFALRFFRVPISLAFALWVAVKSLPLVIEQGRRVALALHARGYGAGSGPWQLLGYPRFAFCLMIPTLSQILRKAEQMWFAVELRGLESILTRLNDGGYSPARTAVAVVLLPVPLVAAILC